MPVLLIRLGILVVVCLLVYLVIQLGRRFVESQRKKALAAPQLEAFSETPVTDTSSVRILAFSSEDCTQCHVLQTPALQRLQQTLGDKITVVDVDAVASPALAKQYHILTVPSTVVLDASGQAQAVNYGFANTHKLAQQVEAVLEQASCVG